MDGEKKKIKNVDAERRALQRRCPGSVRPCADEGWCWSAAMCAWESRLHVPSRWRRADIGSRPEKRRNRAESGMVIRREAGSGSGSGRGCCELDPFPAGNEARVN